MQHRTPRPSRSSRASFSSDASRPVDPATFRLALLSTLIAAAFVQPALADTLANALPTGAQVAAGQAAITQAGNRLVVQQATQRLITNWQSFNIGRDAAVVFNQPGAASVALNRVVGGDASQIMGQLQSNGRVFLLNPQGVVFGSTAQVSTAGLLASTLSMTDADFMAGNYRLSGGGTGIVSNAGHIAGGFVALVAPEVANSGTIDATGGQVALAAGSSARLQLDAGGLISVEVDPSTAASIRNSGTVIADGGRVWMTANQAAPGMASAINQSGTVRADTLASRNGEIWLDGGRGTVELAGTTQARGVAAGSTGGRIVATGDSVRVAGTVDASGAAGGGTVLLGGGYQGGDPSVREAREVALAGTAEVRADATQSGSGGTVVLWSGEHTQMGGALSARGVERGGLIETSSRGALDVAGTVDIGAASGAGGRWLVDPTNVTIDAGNKATYESALNSGGTVDVQADNDIAINDDLSKTTGAASVLNFRAGNNITLALNKAISSISNTLDINFCSAAAGLCAPTTTGMVTLYGQLSTNGGSVHFYKPTTLASAAPISTKRLGVTSLVSGNVTFEQDVTLASPSLGVAISTQGAQSGSTYVGDGGSIEFKGAIQSGIVPSIGTMVPQALALDTTGVVPGAITLRGDVGTIAAPLSKLTLTGPTRIALEGDEINLRATSGDVLVASSTLGTPTLVLGAADTTIRVTGGTVNGVASFADYRQETFDIGVKDATARTLTIESDRSIKIKNRSIDGVTNGGGSALAVNLRAFNAAPAAGGAILLNNATIRSNGGAVTLAGGAGSADGFATGLGSDADGVTDGIQLFNSTIASAGGAVTLRGRAPLTSAGGAGVKLFGLTTVDSGSGALGIDGRVNTASTAGNKDAVIIGEGSTSQTSLLAGAGTLTINGDASAVGNGVTSGSRYDGVIVSSGALIQTTSGDIGITGKGGGNDLYVSDENHGIKLESLNTQVLSNTGNISFAGTSGGKTGSYGIYARGNAMAIGKAAGGTATGNITFAADTMQLVNSSSQRLQVASSGELRIRPLTATQNIEIGTAGAADRLALGSTWFSGANAVFQGGFSGITIGQAGAVAPVESQGTLTVAGATTVLDPLNLRMRGTGGNVVLNAPLTVQGAAGEARTLSLDVANGVSSTTSGLVTADRVHLIGNGNFSLLAPNLIATVAGNALGGNVTINNARGLTVGSVSSTSLGVTTGPATGLSTAANQNITVATSAGDLTVEQNVNAGTGTVSLAATGGAVNETGTASIKAARLAVNALNTSSLANENDVGTLAAATGTVNADFTFVGKNSVAIDSVAGLNGVNVGGTASIRANNGSITQAAAFSASAASLRATGDINLSRTVGGAAVNTIGTLAAKTDNGTIQVVGNGAMTVASAGTVAGGTLTGVDSSAGNKDIRLATTSGNLTLANSVNAGAGTVALSATGGAVNENTTALAPEGTAPIVTAGRLAVTALNTSSLANANAVGLLAATITGPNRDLTFVGRDGVAVQAVTDLAGNTTTGINVTGNVWLQAINGAITQTEKIAASALAAKASGNVDLALAAGTNNIGSLAASSATGTVNLLNGAALTVDSVGTAAAAATLGGPLVGVTTASRDVTLRTTFGGIGLVKAIDAGTATVSMESAAGVGQTDGTVTAGALRVLAAGAVDLQNAGNQVDTLAVATNGELAFRNAGALTVGSVAVALGGNPSTTSGTATGNGEQYIRTGGTLTLAQNVAAGTGTVSIDSASAVAQTGGAITGAALRVIAAGNVDLQQAGNNVATFAAQNGAGSVAYRNAAALNVGSVTGTLGSSGLTTSGVDTAAGNGEQYIRADGAITLQQKLAAGTGTVSLDGTGAIAQAGGSVSAGALRAVAGGSVDLQQAANSVGTFAAQSASGSVAMRNAGTLTVGAVIGTLGSNPLSTSGVDTAAGNGEQYLRTGGALTLAGNLAAGNAVVTLDSASTITQTGGAVTAGALRTISGGSVEMLQAGNNVATFAAQVSGGSVAFANAGALTVGSVTGALGSSALTTNGVDTASGNGDQRLRSGGALTLAQNLSAGGGTIGLEAGAGITQPAGTLNAGALYVMAGGDVDLQQTANNVGRLAGNIARGGFTYRNAGSLTIAAVGPVSGLQADGPISVRTGANLTLEAPVIGRSSQTNAVVLAATNVFQNNAGPSGVSAPSGRWLIYDDNPFLDLSRLGGLGYGFIKTNVRYDGYPPAGVQESGNGYLTTVRPPLPEQFARQPGGDAEINTSGNVTANSALEASLSAANAPTVSNIRIDSAMNAPRKSGDVGAQFVVPLVIDVEPGRRFAADLRSFIGSADVETLQLADGSALPAWLSYNAPSRAFFGLVPADFKGPLRVRLVLRGATQKERRTVDVQFALK